MEVRKEGIIIGGPEGKGNSYKVIFFIPVQTNMFIVRWYRTRVITIKRSDLKTVLLYIIFNNCMFNCSNLNVYK